MIRRYWFWFLVGACAILAGFLYVAPQLAIKSAVEESGRAFVLSQFNHLDDGGDAYLQFAREVYEGHFPPRDLYLDQSKPNIYPPIPPLVLSIFVFLSGGDIVTGYLIALFVIPAILFLFFFWLGWIIFNKNKIWSLFIAFAGILTPIALLSSRAFFSLEFFGNIVVKNFYPGINTLLPLLFWSRIDYPLLTSLIYLPAIALFLLFWERPKMKTAIGCGIVSGLLFYTYFHIWSYWVTVGGLLLLASIFFFKGDRQRLKNYFLLASLVIAISIPYFLNQVSLNQLSSYDEYINRLGIETGRAFRLEAWPYYLIYAVLAALVYWFLWRDPERKKRALFYWAVLAAAVVVWNVQMILGFVPHADHWPRASDPIIFLIIFDLLYIWSKKFKIVPVLLIVLMALLVSKKIVNAVLLINPPQKILIDHTMPEDFLDSWKWLSENIEEPRIVSPSFVSGIYSMAFSSARPFMPTGGLAPISNFEIEERFLISNRLFKVPESVLEARLRDGKGIICNFDCDRLYSASNLKDARLFMYQLFYEKSAPRNKIPENKITELLDRYRKIGRDWKSVDAEYAYYGPLERQFTKIELAKREELELVYRNSSVEIYKIKKSGS